MGNAESQLTVDGATTVAALASQPPPPWIGAFQPLADVQAHGRADGVWVKAILTAPTVTAALGSAMVSPANPAVAAIAGQIGASRPAAASRRSRRMGG